LEERGGGPSRIQIKLLSWVIIILETGVTESFTLERGRDEKYEHIQNVDHADIFCFVYSRKKVKNAQQYY
jgi:hypothetical protein